VSVVWYPPTRVPTVPPTDLSGRDHPSRKALRRVLNDPDDPRAWQNLAALYDSMAGIWTDWADGEADYLDPVHAGLQHARDAAWVLEVCCGTGQASPLLAAHTRFLLATDVNAAMVADAPALPHTTYGLADVRALPVRTGSVPLLAGLNAVPHIAEFRRVLRSGGQLLWCSSFGPDTPLYVSPDELLDLFGPDFQGAAGRAGYGDWTLLTRD
jgi:SAM-dependent methyltransferase